MNGIQEVSGSIPLISTMDGLNVMFSPFSVVLGILQSGCYSLGMVTMYSIQELASIVKEAVAGHPVSSVTLVGSYAKNSATECSDVDLVLDGDDIADAYWDILFFLEDRLKVPVDMMTMRGLENSLLKDAVMEGGVVLYEA